MFAEIDIRLKFAALIILDIACLLLKELLSLSILFVAIFVICIYSFNLKRFKIILLFFLFPVLIYLFTHNLSYAISWFRGILRLCILLLSGWLFAANSTGQEIVKLLDKVRIPKKISFTLGASLQFLPKIITEYANMLDIIKNKFELSPKKIIKQYKFYIRIFMMPIIIRCVQIADELAQASELKGFSSPFRKVFLKHDAFKRNDYIFIFIFFILVFFTLLINFLHPLGFASVPK